MYRLHPVSLWITITGVIGRPVRRDPAQRERGASLVEYALLVALIALACVAAIGLVGGNTGGSLSRSNSSLFG